MTQNPPPKQFMEEALSLARKGIGHVEPNPPVGAVITKDQEVIGSGYHREFGGPHAEVHALEEAGEQARGATLYVTLEPCCVTKKTPPCTEAIIDAGIEKVVLSILDPSLPEKGKGVNKLIEAGITVRIGLLRKEGADLARRFLHDHTKDRPYLVAKWAMSLDGKISTRTGDSKWITSEKARQRAKQYRVQCGAVMVGSNTALQDNPTLLGPDQTSAKQPIRIVVDSSGKLTQDMNLCTTTEYAQTLLATTEQVSTATLKELEGQRVKTLVLPQKNGRVCLSTLFEKLGDRQIQSIFLEGGGTLIGSAFKEDFIDEIYAFVAPKIVGGEDAVTPVEGEGIKKMSEARIARIRETENIDSDHLIHGQIREAVPPSIPESLREYDLSRLSTSDPSNR